ncbi:hypothetical protein [Bacillus albus]|uniref:hypothetical protein n=1 Tax=Bacillus albus TaxID=2026189 RepID=UPI00141A18AA|nr:hypothetical protein [Bacillus albus]
MNPSQFIEQLNRKNFEFVYKTMNDFYEERGKQFLSVMLKYGFLINPMTWNDKEKERYTKMKGILNEFILEYNDDEKTNLTSIQAQLKAFLKMLDYINITVYSNSERLKKSSFFKLSYAEKLIMICVHLEDQKRLGEKFFLENKKPKNYFTNLEPLIADLPSKVNGGTVSIHDNYEGLLDNANGLLAFIMYLQKEINSDDLCFSVNQINSCPYVNSSYEEIMYLTNHKVFFDYIWELIKYRGWDMAEQDENISLQPPNDDAYKLERAGIERFKIYMNTLDVQNSEGVSAKRARKVFSKIEKKIDVNSIHSLFSLSKSDIEANKGYLRGHFRAAEIILEQSYTNRIFYHYIDKEKTINVQEILDFLCYLKSIAVLYQGVIYNLFNSNNDIENDEKMYHLLAPVIRQNDIITHYSNLYKIPFEKVKKMFSYFTYTKAKKSKEIFSNPFIHIDTEYFIFTPSLIQQINISRFIQLVIDERGLTEKGKFFEEKIRNVMNYCPFIDVNQTELEFNASDDEMIEYDLLAKFHDYYLLIEMKCMNKPYDVVELDKKWNTVNKCIKQLNRREKILLSDWDEIRKRSDIELGEIPPEKDKIIKIACLNVFDYTGIEKNDVIITDFSTLLKYFLSPEIDVYSYSLDNKRMIKRQVENLWNERTPMVEEFIKYLQMPVTVEYIYDCLEKQNIRNLLIKKDDPQFFVKDYILTKDPYLTKAAQYV